MSKALLSALLAILLLSVFVLVNSVNIGSVAGQTVTGVINEDTTWTLANSPYELTGNVLVNQTATLTIEPGVTINLNSYYLRVAGTLKAEGTSANKITITRSDPNQDFQDGSAIQFTSTSSPWNATTETGCIISNAYLSSSTKGMTHTIEITSASPLICNSTIINTGDQRAVWIEFGNPTTTGPSNPLIINNSISSNTQGVTITSSYIGNYNWNCTIANNIISNCWTGIDVSCGTPVIEGNLIINNTGPANSGRAGIIIDSVMTSAHPIVRNNTIAFNLVGIVVSGTAEATLFYNNLVNTTEFNIRLSQGVTDDINATYNWWGTTDPQTISQSIYDFKNDFNLRTVNFDPFLTSPNVNTPTCAIVTAGTGGSISSSGIDRLNFGDSKTYSITPNNGYHIADVKVNGTSIGTVTSYDLQDIGGLTTIDATFAPDATPTPTSPPAQTSQPTQNPTSTPTVPEFSIATVLFLIAAATAIVVLIKSRLQNRCSQQPRPF